MFNCWPMNCNLGPFKAQIKDLQYKLAIIQNSQESMELPLRNIEEEQCSICLTSSTKPVRCKGPCHKVFCIKCAAQAKCNDDRCPHRCSQPFQVQAIDLPLRCPFAPQECILSIDSQRQLDQHYLICPLVGPEKRLQIEQKHRYMCGKGHPLTFLPKQGLQILYGKHMLGADQSQCAECGQKALCRSICIHCSIKDRQENFCSDCRMPPCSKTKCPLGHKLKTRKKPGKFRVCDLCDLPAGFMSSKEVHGFCSCDFDMCGVCYSKLPESHEMIPLKWKPEKIWPLSLVKDVDSDDSDWQK